MPKLKELPVRVIDDREIRPRHGEPQEFVLDEPDDPEPDEAPGLANASAQPADGPELGAEEAIKALARSIREVGVLQPVHVVETEGGRYRLVMGGRRLRAAKAAGKATVPALVWAPTEAPDPELMTLTENLHRADWDPIERAQHLKRYQERLGLSQVQLAKKLGVPRITVRRWLLPAEVDPKYHHDLRSGRLPLTVVEEAYTAARREGRPEHADEVIAQYLQGASRSALREAEREQLPRMQPLSGLAQDRQVSQGAATSLEQERPDPVWELLQQLAALTLRARRVQAVQLQPKHQAEFRDQLRSVLLTLDHLVRNLFGQPLVEFVRDLLGEPTQAAPQADVSPRGAGHGDGAGSSGTAPSRGGRRKRATAIR